MQTESKSSSLLECLPRCRLSSLFEAKIMQTESKSLSLLECYAEVQFVFAVTRDNAKNLVSSCRIIVPTILFVIFAVEERAISNMHQGEESQSFKLEGFLIVFVALMIVLQILLGNFPLSFVAFPVNVAIAVLWVAAIVILHREMNDNPWLRLLGSGRCSLILLALFVTGCLLIGLFVQSPDYRDDGFIGQLGLHSFTTSWIFVGILFLLMTNLLLVILRHQAGMKRHRIRFLLNHVGLWIVLLASFFGSADTQKVRVMALRDQPTMESFDIGGKIKPLEIPITFKTFKVDYFDNGMPSYYEATLLLGKEMKRVEINHPCRMTWDTDLYLVNYDMEKGDETPYCVLEVVTQPWRYVTMLGIVMMACGAVLLFIYGRDKTKKDDADVG
jgi:hypothetical protein